MSLSLPSKVRRGLGPRLGPRLGRRRLLLRGRDVDLRGHLTEEGSAEGGEGQAEEEEETDEGEGGRGRSRSRGRGGGALR